MGICIISRFYYSSVELIIFIRVLLFLRDRVPEMGHGNTVAKDVYMFIRVCVYTYEELSIEISIGLLSKRDVMIYNFSSNTWVGVFLFLLFHE